MKILSKLALAVIAVVVLALGPIDPAHAQVQVTSADPASAVQGTSSLNVTINGSGFDSSAAVKFLVAGTAETGGITVKKVTVRSAKRLIATIDVADTAIVNKFDIEVTLSSGRKGKGTTLFTVLKKAVDPCTVAGIDFPGFAYWKPSGKGIEVLVADATGKCSRSVIKSTGTGPTLQFSYPVVGADGVTRGRVVWVDAPAVVAVDFTVAAGTNQISVGPRRTIYVRTGGHISLSRDGHTLYTNNYLESGETVINRLGLDPIGNPTPVFIGAADSVSSYSSFSVNGDETLLYADYSTYAGGSRVYQLLWIPLDGSNTYNVIDQGESQSGEFNPAADPWSNRVAYQRPTATSGYCESLVTSDVSGYPAYPLQPADVIKSTWLNGKVLADGRALSTRGDYCAYTGTIMQTDPVTGEQTALTSGYDPDGR